MTLKTAIITGGSSGIGYRLASHYSASGYRVIIVGRSIARLQAAASALVNVECFEADLESPKSRSTLCAYLAEQTQIHVLINCAGRPFKSKALSFDMVDLEAALQLLFISQVEITRAAWPALLRTKGTVVNVVSVEGSTILTSKPAYNAAKHAALSWSRSLCLEASGQGVHVLTVSPGATATAGFPNTMMLSSWWKKKLVMTEQDCCNRIIKALESRKVESYQPEWWRILVVLEAIFPSWFVRRYAPKS